MAKYLLSTGQSTEKIERYILDLFKLNLSIWPGDIPNSNVGFDFILTDVKKDEVSSEVRFRMRSLIDKIKSQFGGISIELESLEILDETRVRATIRVNQDSDEIEINLYNT